MIHFIRNNKTANANVSYNSATAQAVTKCLHFIKNVLKLDIKIGVYDSSCPKYKFLVQTAQTKPFIELKEKIFIPIFAKNRSIWGFIEINCKLEKPTPIKVRKTLQAIKDTIEPELETLLNDFLTDNSNYSLLVFGGKLEKSYKMASDIFHSKKFTSFINLTEWIQQDDSFSLKTLREFSDSLLFVPEILDLKSNERSILALYSMLPDKLKQSSLIICTRVSFKALYSLIKNEKGFLSTFSTKKTPFNNYLKNPF